MKILLLLLILTLIPAIAYATGPTPQAAPTATAAGGSGSAIANAGGGDQTVRSYGVGGTGLTSTAPCLGSLSILFGLGAGTSIEKGCVLRHYAAMCKDDACRHRFACIDPDLIDEGKAALGCKKPE